MGICLHRWIERGFAGAQFIARLGDAKISSRNKLRSYSYVFPNHAPIEVYMIEGNAANRLIHEFAFQLTA